MIGSRKWSDQSFPTVGVVYDRDSWFLDAPGERRSVQSGLMKAMQVPTYGCRSTNPIVGEVSRP